MQSQQLRPVVFFDGLCNLCNASVKFILRNERDSALRFASLQSQFAANTLNDIPVHNSSLATLILLEDGKEYHRSDAALRLCRYLRGPWRYGWYAIYLPRLIRDGVYNIVSRYRYAVFGRRDTCIVPSPKWESRFIEV